MLDFFGDGKNPLIWPFFLTPGACRVSLTHWNSTSGLLGGGGLVSNQPPRNFFQNLLSQIDWNLTEGESPGHPIAWWPATPPTGKSGKWQVTPPLPPIAKQWSGQESGSLRQPSYRRREKLEK